MVRRSLDHRHLVRLLGQLLAREEVVELTGNLEMLLGHKGCLFITESDHL